MATNLPNLNNIISNHKVYSFFTKLLSTVSAGLYNIMVSLMLGSLLAKILAFILHSAILYNLSLMLASLLIIFTNMLHRMS